MEKISKTTSVWRWRSRYYCTNWKEWLV